MDRRAIFFFGAAVLAALLVPFTDDQLRWVPIWVAVTYVVLAAVSWLDWWSSQR